MNRHLLLPVVLLVACRDETSAATPMGASSSSSSSGSSSGETETEESTGSSGSESSTTGPMPCVGNEDCPDAGAPFCEPSSGECVACDGTEDPDGACAGVDPGLPVCDGGTCVQCTAENPVACTGKTPVCDAATNTCVPCTAHDQCGGAACNLYIGACLPGDRVVEVGGPKPEAYGTLQAAIDSFAAGEEGTIIVHPGMPDYDESVTVDAGRVLAFLAADIGSKTFVPPLWAGVDDVPQMTVEAGSTVLMDGLEVSGNLSSIVPGVLVDGGRAWLDRSRVVQNSGGGIVAQSNAELVLRNCFVGGGADVIGVEIIDASATVLYSTVTASTFGATPALSCTTPVTVDFRNSIIVSQGGTPPDEVACAGASITYSATEGAVPGESNVAVGMFPGASPGDWFMGYTTGDFHLQNDGLTLFADVAQWQAGDPPTDIDGDPRPAVDGSPDYAGADVPAAMAKPELDR